jgi:hypothetical protein
MIVLGLAIGAAGALLLLGVGTGSSVAFILIGLAVLGLGMATATIPATGLLVSGLPVQKAGVGSSMNDVTREFGTAFGIAALGTVLSLRYSARLGHLPLNGRDASSAHENVANALAIAHRSPKVVASSLRSGADAAFVSGFRAATLVGAALLVALAVVTWIKLPRDATIQTSSPTETLDTAEATA